MVEAVHGLFSKINSMQYTNRFKLYVLAVDLHHKFLCLSKAGNFVQSFDVSSNTYNIPVEHGDHPQNTQHIGITGRSWNI